MSFVATFLFIGIFTFALFIWYNTSKNNRNKKASTITNSNTSNQEEHKPKKKMFGVQQDNNNAAEVMIPDREFTIEEISKHDGSNADLPVYLAVNGIVFDVSAGRAVYAPGGGYSVFAGIIFTTITTITTTCIYVQRAY
eukprot:GEZU01020541.1.p1 GENE.GEZU01020541.1~~GEZU01020541.1.p1  ORF type:complete len:139 (-),score=20.72 GEZU01020541.1:6-422(-)